MKNKVKQAHFRFCVSCKYQMDVLQVLLRVFVVPVFLVSEREFTFTTCEEEGFLFLSVPFYNDYEAYKFIWGVEDWFVKNGLDIPICSDYTELDKSPVFDVFDEIPF